MKISLKYKVICIILLVATVLAAGASAISYKIYSNTMDEHYKTLAANITETTARLVDLDDAAALTDQVMDIYRGLCDGNTAPDFDSFTDEEWEEYFAEFDSAVQSEKFTRILDTLNRIEESNQVECIYICYMDMETDKCVYIIDSADPADSCLPGTCDAIEDNNRELMESGIYDFPAYITNYPEYGWLCSAATAIKDEDGNVIANAYVDISMDDVMEDRYAFLTELIVFLSIATIIMIVLIIVFISSTIVRPINQLAKATGQFVSDKEEEEGKTSLIEMLNIKTGDEIQTLSESIQTMEREINSYIDNLSKITAEKERIGAELDVATRIQANMLPSTFPAFPERFEFDIHAVMDPAKEVGGDFYDFFLVDEDHFAMVMADVSGKGVPAALFMVIAKTLIKNSAQTMMSPKAILERVNKQLCENNDAEMFVTVWLGILEISTGNLVAANAGHEYPVIKRANGNFELIKDKHGFVLAGFEMSKYREYTIHLEKGDKLFLYTDGVPEATRADNELYGTGRMLDVLNENQNASPKELLSAVRSSIDAFVEDAPQFDDITMMCFELKDNGAKKCISGSLSELQMEDVLAFAETFLADNDVPMGTAIKMNIAVDEIYSNIQQYSGANEVTITCSIGDNCVEFVFTDDGAAYDPLQKEDPDTTLALEEREIGGLGIFMVKKSMDTMEYEYKDGKNILKVSKKFK